MSPGEYYKSGQDQKRAELDNVDKAIKRLSSLRLLLAFLIIAAGYWAFNDHSSWIWILPVVLIAVFLQVVRKHASYKLRQSIVQKYIRVFDAELKALDGDNSSFDPGIEFIDPLHPYSYDLDIFGLQSVYQMICRAVTINGASELASLFKHPYTPSESIKERQRIILELASKPDFLVDFRVSGLMSEEGAGDLLKIRSWLEMPDYFVSVRLLRLSALSVPLFTIMLFILSFIREGIHPGFTAIVIFNWLLLGQYSKKIKEAGSLLARNIKIIDKYEALHGVVMQEEFTEGRLYEIRNRSSASLAAIMKFRKLVQLFESRYNGMVGPLMNSLFLFDIQCLIRLEKWRSTHKEVQLRSFDDLIYLDTFMSYGIYSFNHPHHVLPMICEQGHVLKGDQVIHPLLSDNAVGNDFVLGANERFYLLTGANMTGKSTFIRTVGLSLIFSYLGLPVRCRSLTIPLIRLYTAIRISDSVQEDISYFKAELNRITAIMEQVSATDKTYLVLLDEPLRGTNTNDKQNGTRSIIKKLAENNAIGIVATHDTVLCALEQEYRGDISNYHFESQVEGKALKFDYLLKPGCSTSNNATLLMEQLGIV